MLGSQKLLLPFQTSSLLPEQNEVGLDSLEYKVPNGNLLKGEIIWEELKLWEEVIRTET